LDQLFLAEAIPESTDLGDTSLDLMGSPASNDDENPLTEYTDRLQTERRKLLRQLGTEAHEKMLPPSCAGLQAAIKEAQKQIEHLEARLDQLDEMAEASHGVEQRAAALGRIHTGRRQLELLRQRLDRRYRRLGRVIFKTPELSGVVPTTCRQLRRIQERIEALITPPGRARSVRSPFRRHKQS
jgi:chromosome segregation ATPase